LNVVAKKDVAAAFVVVVETLNNLNSFYVFGGYAVHSLYRVT